MLFCMRVPNFVQIGPRTAELWRHRFSRWRSQSCICFGVMADHPRNAFCGLNNRLFVGLIVPEILRCIDFGVLAWNCLFTPLFWRMFGAYFSHYDVTHRLDPPKGPSLGGNTSFEPFSVRISATVRPGRVNEKKYIIKPPIPTARAV